MKMRLDSRWILGINVCPGTLDRENLSALNCHAVIIIWGWTIFGGILGLPIACPPSAPRQWSIGGGDSCRLAV